MKIVYAVIIYEIFILTLYKLNFSMYSISVVDLFDGCDDKIYDTQKNKMTEIMHSK